MRQYRTLHVEAWVQIAQALDDDGHEDLSARIRNQIAPFVGITTFRVSYGVEVTPDEDALIQTYL